MPACDFRAWVRLKRKEYIMKAAIIGAIGSILGNVINTQQVNKANQQLTAQTNAANVAMVREQNRAAALEAEKAYQRSLPTNQVANMMSAGMSRAGALNAINGGGSYTPAPVNVAQNEAPQMQGVDFSALANVGMAISAQKSQERMHAKDIALERDKFEYEKKRTTQNDAYDNIIKTFQAAKIQSEAQTANLEWLVKEFTQDERIDAEKQRLIAEKAKSLSDELQSKLYKGALDDVDSETLKSLFKYQAVLEMLGNIGHMTTEKAIQIIHDVKEILIPG